VNEGNGEQVFIPQNAVVKVTKMNHIIEVQHMEKMNRQNNIKKLDKDRYVDIGTGEIKEFQHTENRQQGYNSLRQTFKKMRYLINNNFTGQGNELHAVLTYKENMMDSKQLYKDFDKFMKRLRYKYKNVSSIDYLLVVEPQGRGAWHCHVLIRFNELDKVFIKNKDLRELWSLGFVTIKSLKDIDNIGAYLSAYLTDIEIEQAENDLETAFQICKDGCSIETKIVEGKEKKFIKGGRLHMYPPGMNMYRKSKGIIPPDREELKFKDIKKIVGAATPHYQKSYHIENDDFENTISFLQYNTKRK